MKTSLEQEDIQAIASTIMDLLKPVIAGNGKHEVEDKVFDKKGLSGYLQISVSTVNKMVSNKEIPHFKIQPGQSGGVRFFKKDVDKWIARQTIPEINQFKGRR